MNFWNDVWLPNAGILQRFYIGHGNLLDSLQVCDVVTEEVWDQQWLALIVPQEIVEHILVCTPLSLNAGTSHLTWRWLSGGNLSISKPYKHLFVDNPNVRVESDELTWKVRAPQRVQIFLWLLARGKLLTNKERAK